MYVNYSQEHFLKVFLITAHLLADVDLNNKEQETCLLPKQKVSLIT